MIYEDLFGEPSFFDPIEVRRTKEIERASLTEEEIAEIEAMKKAMEELPIRDPCETEFEYDDIPVADYCSNVLQEYMDADIGFFAGDNGYKKYEDYVKTLSDEDAIALDDTLEMMHDVENAEPIFGEWDEELNYFDRCEEREKQKAVNDVLKRMLPYKPVSDMTDQKAKASASVVTEKEEAMKVGSFLYKNEYLYFMTDDEHGVVIANFFIKVVKEKITVTENVNEQNEVVGYEETTTWQIIIYCLGEKFEAEVTIAALYNEREILKITKDRGYIEPSKSAKDLIKRYLNEIIKYRECPTVYEFASTGWTKNLNGKWHYLTDVGVIGHPEINARANVTQHFIYDHTRVGSKGVFEEFYGLRNLCPKKPEQSVFLMHYTCLSVMTSIFQEVGHGINFVVALIGPTNTRKTSSAIVFSRIFDRTPKAAADIRFDSTDGAIREKMESYGDAILLVDDFLPYENKSASKDQMRKSEILIRGYGDRVPRKRSKAYSQINGIEAFNRVKGCCMITGEVFEANSESSLTRVIQIPFETGSIDLDLLSFYQNNLLNVPTFVHDFICFVEANVENIFALIKQEVVKARTGKNMEIRTPRYRDTMGILKAEIRIFYSYAKSKGFMTEVEIEEAMIRDEEFIKKLVCENDVDTKVKSPAAVICTALQNAIATNKLYVVTEEESESMLNFDKAVIENAEYLMILSETLQRVYATYCRETNREVMYKNGREMANPLKKEEAIFRKEESGGPRFTHKIKGKTGKRFLFIKKTKFAEFCNIFNEF